MLISKFTQPFQIWKNFSFTIKQKIQLIILLKLNKNYIFHFYKFLVLLLIFFFNFYNLHKEFDMQEEKSQNKSEKKNIVLSNVL